MTTPAASAHLGRYLWLAGAAVFVTAVWRRTRSGSHEPLYLTAGRRLLMGDRPVSRAQCITIQRPAAEVFRALRDVEQMPRFMTYLRAVEEIEPGKLRCTARLPGGAEVQWEEHLVVEREGKLLTWEVAGDSALTGRGSVILTPAPADRGTEVTLEIEFGGSRVGGLLAGVVTTAMREGLRRLKQWVETGEIATVRGQPSARCVEHQRPELRATAARVVPPERRRRHEAPAYPRESEPEQMPAVGIGG